MTVTTGTSVAEFIATPGVTEDMPACSGLSWCRRYTGTRFWLAANARNLHHAHHIKAMGLSRPRPGAGKVTTIDHCTGPAV